MSGISDVLKLEEKRSLQEDPFRYGWRLVRGTQADGSDGFLQIPLTLEDVLHPQEEDFIVQNLSHAHDCIYLFHVLQVRLESDPTAAVIFDCHIAWDAPVLPSGPDIIVLLGVRELRNVGTFDIAAEGATPLLVIEVTSPDTRINDMVHKVVEYHLAGVPYYYIADARETREGAHDVYPGISKHPHGIRGDRTRCAGACLDRTDADLAGSRGRSGDVLR